MAYAGKKIAVTGADGFVGRYVVRALEGMGANVLPLTRRDVDIGCGDLPDHAAIGAPDAMVHLAWGKLDGYKDRVHFEEILPAHYAFLKHLIETGLPALTVAGTCFEYGLREGVLREADDVSPHLPYGFAKDALRRQLMFLQGEHGFALTWARLFYMYGHGQPQRTLYAQLESAIARGDTAFNMSPGDQIRDFLHVEEVARKVSLLTLSGVDHGVINVCSGHPLSVRRFAEKILSESGADMKLNLGFYPYPVYEGMAFWGDTSKLDRALQA